MARIVSASEKANLKRERDWVEGQAKRRSQLLAPLVRKAIEGLKEEIDSTYTEIANRFGALTVACESCGYLLLRENGEVLTLELGNDARPRIAQDVRPYLRTFRFLRKKYPEITRLLLERPVSGVDCPECSGTGANRSNLECGQCHGLGWVTNYPLTFCSSGTPRKRGAP